MPLPVSTPISSSSPLPAIWIGERGAHQRTPPGRRLALRAGAAGRLAASTMMTPKKPIIAAREFMISALSTNPAGFAAHVARRSVPACMHAAGPWGRRHAAAPGAG